MHAYLIVGTDIEEVKAKSEELAKKLKAKIFEFPLQKIGDVRSLESFTKLKVSEPTATILYSIEVATEEALNALLKNLEEPQENLFYILTTTSVHKVLPTIVSRCQIIKVKSEKLKVKSEEIENFLEMSVGGKLAYLDKIRDRKEAVSFLENLILVYHQKLHESTDNYAEIAQNIDQISKTLNNIKANGNVTLQLANLAVNGV
ncbi:hypothetical protein A2210_03245 [Candidatus Woesebacteria bacterium RIFOXYA1_FULL_40_18]|uniref:Polymerase III, delta prime subunit protein n=5 Tax=Candidatus Woeseibacteriota TaxID=1752722 RepID=A0A0G0VLJ1_9BACT|nr:MAG: polymerase III, delta prime subunit protein [Candidatus Woesebacteria bacterium GW2011_GWB1_40_101]KKR63657.1 MAG: polymerase III, delta prime subunit protein [Candidatus Woesebacteria bacterium GW2011_GWA1_40_45]OGM75580.1 MAG: hypothetical protein A2210_03245 [Candidatus Woesebacteria bacterium RIFOXYA1_FULL_40_18]OGM81833.1 MAG: hypothetical protein A2361_01950 [Candidatus Woesebacteria bacterium RIFOXYB1_FULL_40_26]OGM88437.1 MAG: hypothetical protein A2614_02020 [Candidatus Woeseba